MGKIEISINVRFPSAAFEWLKIKAFQGNYSLRCLYFYSAKGVLNIEFQWGSWERPLIFHEILLKITNLLFFQY